MAQNSSSHVASSQKALMLEMKSLQEEPVEGFKITLVDEADLYNWEVAIFGPPNTLYEGGYFKARIRFPIDYPYSPPAFRFLTKMWHPNIYEVLATKAEAERDGVKVPTTLAEYCVRTRAPATDEGSDLFYDDYYDDEDLEDNNDEDCCYDEDDSGNEES
ncbi:Ubiquitin-conjugating enzyme E2 R2 [Bagarius yarrelli]|uniref:Ubiquitin-conjugating enzyme E2 R2 n=1 Tax=Bagarius yarrelli TaxID=175774 RepID=A0A556UZ98_BAGYA|nr:Ubiquitin-conjugating enzyme E2 R2 [Bagarius yarrelli]